MDILFSHKKNKVLISARTWINFKNIVLNKINQSQKTIYSMISFIYYVQNRQIHRGREKCLLRAGGKANEE